mmetsp:Transcript_5970/g.8801  ORF Transcript_5970/g.8801 Transcript_5970/m.8801 type:complete len:272 (+) Transcript_5970:930-1745(+)
MDDDDVAVVLDIFEKPEFFITIQDKQPNIKRLFPIRMERYYCDLRCAFFRQRNSSWRLLLEDFFNSTLSFKYYCVRQMNNNKFIVFILIASIMSTILVIMNVRTALSSAFGDNNSIRQEEFTSEIETNEKALSAALRIGMITPHDINETRTISRYSKLLVEAAHHEEKIKPSAADRMADSIRAAEEAAFRLQQAASAAEAAMAALANAKQNNPSSQHLDISSASANLTSSLSLRRRNTLYRTYNDKKQTHSYSNNRIGHDIRHAISSPTQS